MAYLIDTDVMIDVSRGNPNAASYLDSLSDPAISIVTAQELIVGARNKRDVAGIDSAHKLTILASLAFGARVDFEHIPVEGIDRLELMDVAWGGELGYVVKLLAIGERMNDHKLSLRVHPCLVGRDNPLASVDGPFNAISIFGHAVGHVLLYGRGAGQSPTASAVIGAGGSSTPTR